ncbi:PPC domain-containing protein [Aquimarina gracilis]|uniref:PPC domain-containing protein n=1 Tax=Aquimarina gracilis TaxID=874422 RepID=A0ABU6A172_9FLAO|nr:PPC domain-containing protein [Aquimarina gracilis]MEB3347836.1 PPC domain-containing protein [Aquimarina gracilis]
MKTQILKALLVLSIIFFVSCSNDDDATPVDTGVTLFEKEGEWDCEIGHTCEDIYQFEFKEGSRISISIDNVTGSSVVSLDLAADFGQFGGPNILNEGALSYYGCTGQDGEVSLANILISETGTYNLAIARDWGLSAGFDGTYKLIIVSDTSFTEGIAPTNDTEVQNYVRECL